MRRRNLASAVGVLGALAALAALAAGCGGGTRWSTAAPTTNPAAAAPGALGGHHPRSTTSRRGATGGSAAAPDPARTGPGGPGAGPAPGVTSPGPPPAPGTGSPTTGPPVHADAAPAGWIVYHDPSGVTLQHPTGWTVQPGSLGPLVVSIDGAGTDLARFRRNVNVLEQPLAAGLTAAGYLDVSLREMAATGGTVDDNRATTLAGAPGRQVTWHVTKGGSTVRFLSIWTVRDRLAFLVTYSSDDHNFAAPLAEVHHLVASIRLPPTS